jgi:hypothetical protein
LAIYNCILNRTSYERHSHSIAIKNFFNEIGVVSLEANNNKAYLTVKKIQYLNYYTTFLNIILCKQIKINLKFDLWAEIVKILFYKAKEIKKREGILKILSLKSNLNNGLYKTKTLIA